MAGVRSLTSNDLSNLEVERTDKVVTASADKLDEVLAVSAMKEFFQSQESDAGAAEDGAGGSGSAPRFGSLQVQPGDELSSAEIAEGVPLTDLDEPLDCLGGSTERHFIDYLDSTKNQFNSYSDGLEDLVLLDFEDRNARVSSHVQSLIDSGQKEDAIQLLEQESK